MVKRKIKVGDKVVQISKSDFPDPHKYGIVTEIRYFDNIRDKIFADWYDNQQYTGKAMKGLWLFTDEVELLNDLQTTID